MLLNDVRILENIEILSEAKSPQGMKIRGLFQRADEENNNNRVYPKQVLENQVKGLQDMINENRLCGELDHPSHDIVKLSNASHLITGLYMEGNDVIGEAKVLDTPAGKVAQALIEGGVKIGISSRGVGTLSEDTMKRVKYVNEDFKLVTFDLVADPSTRGAFPSLSESTENNERTRKIVNDTYKKALGEKVFVTMLKESFDSSLQEADKPYENDKSSYDDIMKMRGYPSVDDVMKNKVKEDPFYKAMMKAVTGATPVKTSEITLRGIQKAGRGQAALRKTQAAGAKADVEAAEKKLGAAAGEHEFQKGSLDRSAKAAQRRQNKAQRRSFLQRVGGVLKGKKFGDTTEGETERFQRVRDKESAVEKTRADKAQAQAGVNVAKKKQTNVKLGAERLTPAQVHDKAVANINRKKDPEKKKAALERLGPRPADDHKGIERERPDKSDAQRLAAIKKRFQDPNRKSRLAKGTQQRATKGAAATKAGEKLIPVEEKPQTQAEKFAAVRARGREFRRARQRRMGLRNNTQPTYNRMAEFLGEVYKNNKN